MSEMLNYTPHDVDVHVGGDANLVTYKARRNASIRLAAQPQVRLGTLDNGVAVYEAQRFTHVDFPDFPAGTHGIIVSMPVGNFVQAVDPGKTDQLRAKTAFPGSIQIYSPDTGPGAAVRNDKKELIGTRRLAWYAAITSREVRNEDGSTQVVVKLSESYKK